MVFRGKFREGLWVGSRARSGKQADSSCVGLQHILLKETPFEMNIVQEQLDQSSMQYQGCHKTLLFRNLTYIKPLQEQQELSHCTSIHCWLKSNHNNNIKHKLQRN
uniref:Uncharacterized protein n=1 Tax=Glycine max TaxID=3847 RepID=C6T7H5_SOYBN|nr:unknown [Glycine max]